MRVGLVLAFCFAVLLAVGVVTVAAVRGVLALVHRTPRDSERPDRDTGLDEFF